MTETSLLRTVLQHATSLKARWFRNNVGRLRDARGKYVTYGLCVGSSDIIGWTPVVVTPAMVGRTVAVFTALECKVGARTTTVEQVAFLATVQAHGGIAAVVRQIADVDRAIEQFIR